MGMNTEEIKLKEDIEIKRKQMISEALKAGLNNEKVIQYSSELDQLLNRLNEVSTNDE